jgi:hypothetical protein
VTLFVPPLAAWGCSHGSGFLGDMIRRVEQAESKSERFPAGDRQAAWAGHVFIYIGNEQIVEAEWPRVVVSPLSAHPDAVWAAGQPLTSSQRSQGVTLVTGLVGHQYDALAYAYFLAKLAQINTGVSDDFAELEKHAADAGPICSGLMVREQEAMSVDIGPLRTAAVKSPDFVSPADCLRWGLDNEWMHSTVPENWK